MAKHEVTTILPADRGIPALLIRDHDGWAAQVAAERRERLDDQVKAAVADIERGNEERRRAPPTPLAELASGMRANAALAAEAREALPRVVRELAQTEALVAGLAATEPPQPDAARAAWQQANEYSHDLSAWLAAHR